MGSFAKVIALALLLLGVAMALTVNQEQPFQHYTYDDFMRQFHRTYEGEEKAHHQAIFEHNYQEMLHEMNNGGEFGVNRFMDWNETQRKHFFSLKKQHFVISPYHDQRNVAAPSSWDWRAQGAVSPIKSQGDCGSCWTFAAAGVYESKLLIENRSQPVDLSEQYILECESTYSHGCNGGDPLQGLKIIEAGCPLESTFPYKQKDKYYRSSGSPICSATNKVKLQSRTISMRYYQNLSVEQIQNQLYANGPLLAMVYSDNRIFMKPPKTGLINNCPNAETDHAVVLIGYNSSHWFIKNSWDTTWGDQGFGYISKASNGNCGIQQVVGVMQVEGPRPIPTPTPNPNPSPPSGPATDDGFAVYTVEMTDSSRDGWDGCVLALRQAGANVATFGESFTSGASSIQKVKIRSNQQTQVVVVRSGYYPNEVGFAVKDSAGNIVAKKDPGSSFSNSATLADFCAGSKCGGGGSNVAPQGGSSNYTLEMLDYFGDGWNGNVLAIEQGNTIMSFGRDFTSGKFGRVVLPIARGVQATLFVYQVGSDSNQVGYTLKNAAGQTVLQRSPGQSFRQNDVLGRFCPDCSHSHHHLGRAEGTKQHVEMPTVI